MSSRNVDESSLSTLMNCANALGSRLAPALTGLPGRVTKKPRSPQGCLTPRVGPCSLLRRRSGLQALVLMLPMGSLEKRWLSNPTAFPPVHQATNRPDYEHLA